jgi:hypothetical protein
VDDTDNPFRSPGNEEPASAAIPSESDESIDPRAIGKAKYVPTVAILMIVHGVLMVAVALFFIFMIVVMVPLLGQQMENQQDIQRQQNPNAPPLSKEGMTTMLYAVYGGMSAFLFIIGALGIYTGIRNYGYHDRVLGLISLVLNMGSIFFCWCMPLSIGLMIFGMIIYLSPEADRAFRWRSESSEPVESTS